MIIGIKATPCFMWVYSPVDQRRLIATFLVRASNLYICCRPENQKRVAGLDV